MSEMIPKILVTLNPDAEREEQVVVDINAVEAIVADHFNNGPGLLLAGGSFMSLPEGMTVADVQDRMRAALEEIAASLNMVGPAGPQRFA